MGSRTMVYVNEYDLSRHGFVLERVDGLPDGLIAQDRTTHLPGRVGAVILPPESETASRTISVQGTMLGTSLAGTSLANLLSNIDKLKERLYRGTIEVRFVDQNDRYVLARCSGFQVPRTPPQFLNPKSRVSFTLFCPDPLVYDTLPQVIACPVAATKSYLPLGTAPSAPIIRIMGAATNPVLTYRKHDGTSQTTMTFTATLAAADYLEIDCELAQITRYTSGVSSNGMSLWTSGDFIVLDPQHGDQVNGLYPSIEVSAGTLETFYRRSWL